MSLFPLWDRWEVTKVVLGHLQGLRNAEFYSFAKRITNPNGKPDILHP